MLKRDEDLSPVLYPSRQGRDRLRSGIFSEEKGFVLIVALIFLILLTAIGSASIFNATTEIKIAGNTKTASVSLYIAESGMEAVKALLNKSAIDYFSIDGGSNKSITGDYIYSNSTATLNKTLMYPLYWVQNTDNTWMTMAGVTSGSYDYKDASSNMFICTSTVLTSANASWPICKDFTVGDQTARVSLDTPQWSPSAPTRVIIPSVSQHINSNPMKKVSANMEIEFGNSMLIFQSFRDLTTGTAAVDNSITSNFIIGDPTSDTTLDYGIGGTNNTDRITGIYTGSDKVRIRISIDGGTTWANYALPRINGQTATWSANSAFTTDSTPITRNGHLYKVVTAGTSGGTEPTWTIDPLGATVNDGTVVWQEAGDMYLVNSTFIIGGENTTWSANTTYKTTNSEPYTATNRTPITKNGHIYKVAAGGISGATEPTWTTTVGAIVNDRTVVWQECGCMYAGSAFPVNLTVYPPSPNTRFKVDVVSLATNCE